MKIDVIKTGMIQENCYIVSDDGGVAAVIDPGDDAHKLNAFIDAKQLTVEWILLTHGHFDHVGAVAAVKEHTGAKVAVHAADSKSTRFTPDRLITSGDVIRCGSLQFQVIETPGHTPGCVCYICNGAIFSGDTLFYESIGRTDLAGGNFTDMRQSLLKLRDLPYEDIAVYPGHMQATTLAHERAHNPFFGI